MNGLILCLLIPLPLQANSETVASKAMEQAPSAITAEDWLAIRRLHEEQQLEAVSTEEGFRAFNPTQSWNVRFDSRGILVEPLAEDWTWGLELLNYGYGENQNRVLAPRSTTADGARVTNHWGDDLDEWYVNRSSGIEHGFTVRKRPEADPRAATKPLTLAVRILGPLRASIGSNNRDLRFIDERGSAIVTYTGLKAFDSTGASVPAWFEAGSDGFEYCVDDEGASYPLTIDPIIQQAFLKASNTDLHDRFGSDVAVYGDTIAISAIFEESSATGINGDQSDNSAGGSGAVYVFTRTGSTWTQQAYLKASNTEPTDRFGSSLALFGDTLVVGAIFEDSSATGVNGDQSDNNTSAAGAAFVFVRNGTSWSQQAYLKGPVASPNNVFGFSVALCGDTAAISGGYPGKQGRVYVFTRTGTTWILEATLAASNPGGSDGYGLSLDISGDTLIVGARGESSNAIGVNGDQFNNDSPGSGAAYIFERTGTTWVQSAYLKASNNKMGPVGENFGISVSIAGDLAVVGAPNESSDAMGVYGVQFLRAGAAYVFERDGSTWAQQAYLKASNTNGGDRFGYRLDNWANTIVVAAISEGSAAIGVGGDQSSNGANSSGAAYVFERSGSTWRQRDYVKASNTGAGDNFGSSVSVSENTLVVGAARESSDAVGVNGDGSTNLLSRSGAAYAYEIPRTLTESTRNISLATDGQFSMSLDAGTEHAGWFYSIIGSVTGTTPGIQLDDGVNLPLNFDAYTELTLSHSPSRAMKRFRGQLSVTGASQAILTLKPGLDPALAGLTVHHAFVASKSLGTIDFASDAIPLLLVP